MNVATPRTPRIEAILRRGAPSLVRSAHLIVLCSVLVGAIGTPGLSGPFPLPGGGALDIFPILSTLTIGVADASGQAAFPLPVLFSSLTGLVIPFQMASYDVLTGTVPAKSGVATLTVLP